MDDIGRLEEDRNKLRDEERSLIQNLRELSSKLNEVRTELSDHRDKRDQLNETIKLLKQERDQLRTKAKTGIEQFTETRKSTPGGRRAAIAEKELASLEWKVQTTPFDRDQEKRMMQQIRARESQVISNRKLQQLRGEIEKYKQEGDTVHAKIQELAAESQKHHLEIVKLREQSSSIRQEIDETVVLLDVTREKALIAAQKFLMAQNQNRYATRIMRTEKDRAHREGLKATAQEKLEKKEKLSLLELSALYSSGEDEEEDTAG